MAKAVDMPHDDHDEEEDDDSDDVETQIEMKQGHFQKRDSNYGLEEIVKMFARTRFGNKYFRKAGQLFNN